MLEVTKKAGDMIKQFLENSREPGKAIRILLQAG
jgi:Fe-S cluster assembly iron-binding protein IscA